VLSYSSKKPPFSLRGIESSFSVLSPNVPELLRTDIELEDCIILEPTHGALHHISNLCML